MGETLARFDGVTKRFGDFVAVDNVCLEVEAGEVLALLGENGAGKSTLMKLLYGSYAPSSGTIAVNGVEGAISGPADAMRNGIGMVFQHFSQLPALTVRDNLLLAWPETPFWTGKRNQRTQAVLDTLAALAPHISPHRRLDTLSVGEQQIVELAKVLNISARIVILDEPTSVLTPEEASKLHGFVRALAAKGVGVVLITHKLADVEACADRIAIMRRGRIVDISVRGERSVDEIVTLMMGSAVSLTLPKPTMPPQPHDRLVVRGLYASAPGMQLSDISLTVRRGEVLGIAGVAGNGQTLLAEALAGVHPVESGDIVLDGSSIARRSTAERCMTPLGYVPEQPRENAVVETMSLAENINLRAIATGEQSNIDTGEVIERYNVRPGQPSLDAGALSGGNLQKLVIAREFGSPRPAILACYPTMGLDLAAIEMVYRAMFEQARDGAAIVWISEDLDHLLACAHTIAVLREGRIVAVLENDGSLTRDAVGSLMTGANAGIRAVAAA